MSLHYISLPRTSLLTMFQLLIAVVATLHAVILTPETEAAHGTPPKMVLDVERKFRIPLGQKQFKLICPVIANDKDMLMIQWTKNGEQVEWDSRYKLAKDDRELRMKSVRLDDSGRYQCQATNGFGHRTVDFTVHVYDPAEDSISLRDVIVLANSTSAPAWLIDMNLDWSSPMQINRGGRMELRCPARGNPLPEIRWYKNNIRITTDSPPHIASFIVDPAGLDDSGDYRCVLENRLGSIEAIFKVTVGDFFDDGKRLGVHDGPVDQMPEPIIDQPYNTTVRVGHTAQFLCKAKSAQSPLIKWLKEVEDPVAVRRRDPNATIVNASGMHLLVLEQTQVESVSRDGPDHLYTNRLVIPMVTKEHAGRYICVVTSTQGHIVYKAAQLNVVAAYDFGSIGLGMDNFWFFVIPIAVVFVGLVIGAIAWLRCNQEPSSPKCLSTKPPPPPRIPPPVAPAEYPGSAHQFTQEYSIEKTRSPIILNNSMFHQKYPMGIATLDRSNIQRVQRGMDEMTNLYDNSSPQPYWTQQMVHRPLASSIYTANSGNYRTLEVGHPHSRNYPSMCSDEYSEQEQPFITYRR
ncbi:Fibroblast growth factor receptor [Trichostrongylus colubriformis]|uniref:receptor protein-tyrosine kinase n=1 Tax=Trichostrongylus colubriformis TaxID=6319 RepID=A0AAN8II14_TRICO